MAIILSLFLVTANFAMPVGAAAPTGPPKPSSTKPIQPRTAPPPRTGSSRPSAANGPLFLQFEGVAGDTPDTGDFGWSQVLSGDGNTAIISAIGANSNVGTVYFWQRTGTTWAVTDEKQNPTGGKDGYGMRLAISRDGSTALVAAWQTANVSQGYIPPCQNICPYSDDHGEVYSYSRNPDGTWSAQQPMPGTAPPDPNAGTQDFGYSIGLSDDGNTAVVGADGAAFVYTRAGGVWTERQHLPIVSDAAPAPDFIATISGDANTIVVGSPPENDTKGAAFVFARANAGAPFSAQTTLGLGDSGAISDFFGVSVAASDNGNTVIVGAPGVNLGEDDQTEPEGQPQGTTTGAAYAFMRVGATWSAPQKLLSNDAAVGDAFGYSITLTRDGTAVLIGGWFKNQGQGAAYLFKTNGGTFSQREAITADDGKMGDTYTKEQMGLSDDACTAAIGSYEFDWTNGSGELGMEYIYSCTVTHPPPPPGGHQSCAPSDISLQFYPLPAPVRLLDTRAGNAAYLTPGSPYQTDTTYELPGLFTYSGTTIPCNTLALVGNATIADGSNAPGFATLFPSGGTLPTVSNLNYTPGEVVPNFFTVALGPDGGFNVYASATTNVVIDVTGYYAPPSTVGLYYHPLAAPVRLFDSRPNQQSFDTTPGNVPIPTGFHVNLPGRFTYNGEVIPNTALALAGNATIAGGSGAPGFATIYPGDGSLPLASNLNYVPGEVVPNAFIAALGGDGSFNFYVSATTHAVVDISGYYDTNSAGGLLFNPLTTPVRLLDTRPGTIAATGGMGPAVGGAVYSLTGQFTYNGITVPADAQAIVGNATIAGGSSAPGYAVLFPDGVSVPTASNLNYTPGEAVPNFFMVGLNATSGRFDYEASTTTDIIVDISGYFGTSLTPGASSGKGGSVRAASGQAKPPAAQAVPSTPATAPHVTKPINH